METDEFTERLFLIAILRCGVDVASRVLNEYQKVRKDEKIVELARPLGDD